MLELVQPALSVSEKSRTDTLRVNEIFYSIQGEGSRAGERCVFVRLTGCGLRCSYCDTEYAFYEGMDTGVGEVIERVRSYGCNLVELTGGEPLEQDAVYPLINQLCDLGFDVMIETGGHVDISRTDSRAKRIVDLKTPSSGMSKRNYYENISYLTKHDEVKFVVSGREDYEFSREAIGKFDLAATCGCVLMSPVSGEQSLEELAGWILRDTLPVRLQVQLHKLIWPLVERGV